MDMSGHVSTIQWSVRIPVTVAKISYGGEKDSHVEKTVTGHMIQILICIGLQRLGDFLMVEADL